MTGERHDVLTVVAIALLVYTLASLVHEGAGHGGGCLLAGGAPALLSSMQFECVQRQPVSAMSRGVVAAGGTVMQLVVGILALAWYRARMPRTGPLTGAALSFAIWLFAAVNLMQGFGYFLFSGVGGIGDWRHVFASVHSSMMWRVLLAVGGFALYWLTTARLFRMLVPYLGGPMADHPRRARMVSMVSYIAGGALGVAAGLRNPAGITLLMLSGVAATLGGTSGLAWGPETLRGAPTRAADADRVAVITRSWMLIIAGLVAAAVMIGVLGPGIRLG